MTASPSIAVSPIPAVNVACVPQRSPLRYPGGKTWLIPHVRAWLGGPSRVHAPMLIEPFAGGGIVSLTAVMEGLAERCLMAELDRDVAAFWHAALRFGPALVRRVLSFEPDRSAVAALASMRPGDVVEHGFRTLVLNRTRRGGILAPGASLPRHGENGKGVASRWYPRTIACRLEAIERHASRIAFCEADGLQLLGSFLHGAGGGGSELAAFIDPPYTAGGKCAGRRLYAHNQIDHGRLFAMLADSRIDFLMTYDCAPEIIELVAKHHFHAVQVVMKNTHHAKLRELVITRRKVFDSAAPRRCRRTSCRRRVRSKQTEGRVANSAMLLDPSLPRTGRHTRRHGERTSHHLPKALRTRQPCRTVAWRHRGL